ncbi:MAG: prepilin-type N-terminal cleavage/methylation domain-containing protein [Planctomycetota bacterium]|nr:prepilin-type N-terminal cleavage/methylation domain-containing protein [Planctomycetota bacterium]
MNIRRRVRKGFTLVEILIVVVILGILAAIVVPQFTSATNQSRAGNVRAQLRSLENQLELHRARTGQYPAVGADFWNDLITAGLLKTAPVNPVNNSSSVAAAAGATTGWTWTIDANGNGILGASYFDETTNEITATP